MEAHTQLEGGLSAESLLEYRAYNGEELIQILGTKIKHVETYNRRWGSESLTSKIYVLKIFHQEKSQLKPTE